MNRGRLNANLFASIPASLILAFVALANFRGQWVLGEPCFVERISDTALYGAVIAAVISLIFLFVFLRRDQP